MVVDAWNCTHCDFLPANSWLPRISTECRMLSHKAAFQHGTNTLQHEPSAHSYRPIKRSMVSLAPSVASVICFATSLFWALGEASLV